MYTYIVFDQESWFDFYFPKIYHTDAKPTFFQKNDKHEILGATERWLSEAHCSKYRKSALKGMTLFG